MKTIAVASLVLAACLASPASAGLILIDEFDVANANRTVAAPASVNLGAGTLDIAEGAGFFAPVDFYELTVVPGDFSDNPIFQLAGVSYSAVPAGNFGSISMTLDSANAAAVSSPLQALNSDFDTYNFDFSALSESALSDIDSITITFGGMSPAQFSFDTLQAVPEPTTMALIGITAVGGGAAGWRKRRKARKS